MKTPIGFISVAIASAGLATSQAEFVEAQYRECRPTILERGQRVAQHVIAPIGNACHVGTC